MSLSPDQIDKLTEIVNIGFGRAAASLSSLVQQRILLSVPEIRICSVEELPAYLGLPNPQVTTVHQVLAAAAGQARRLRLKPTSLARSTYPQAAKPLSTANGVGRSPLLEQDTHARKRLYLDWQGADDTATRHDFYSTTPGKVQQPEHPLTFTPLCRQDHDP